MPSAGVQLLRSLSAHHSISLFHIMLYREVRDEKAGIPGFTACPGRWFPSAVMRTALQEHSGGASLRAVMSWCGTSGTPVHVDARHAL
jgi:hypothetical protein